jgi:hypothetical protein
MKKLNIAQRLSPYGGAITPSLSITVPPIPIYAEHGVRHACLSASPREQRMKIVLEYTYPQDESKLKHALKGGDYYLALVDIDRMLSSIQAEQDPAEVVKRARYFIDEVLEE